MTQTKNLLALILLVCAATVALYACGGEAPTATPLPPTMTAVPPSPTPQPAATSTTMSAPTSSAGSSSTGGGTLTGPAADLLNKSQDAMRGLKSYHVNMLIDSAGTSITADGDIMNPDKARLSMDMGSAGKFDVVVIGKDSYIKVPGTDSYASTSSAGSAGGLSSISDPNQFAGLGKFANSADIVGDETIDGASTSHIKFSYNLDKAMSDTATATGQATPAASMGNAQGEMWIEKATGYIRQIKLQTPGAAPTTGTPSASSATNITVKYSKFNEDITPAIEKPTNITTIPGMDATGTPGAGATYAPAVSTPAGTTATSVPTTIP